MTEHDDDPFDTWLHGNVEPLGPPPGTFNQIKKRAKRRKMRRAVMSAASAGAAAALIVVAVVALPRVVPSLHSTPKPAAHSVISSPVSTPKTHPPSAPATSPPTSSSVSSSPATLPGNFQPTSVTFINFDDGYVLGQSPDCGGTSCTTMARTTDYGSSWTLMNAPQAGPPDGSTGVSQVRFIDADHGWAFGPQLYQTDNGGESWTPVSTGGMRVTGLEAVGNMAYAVFAQCSGTGASYGSDCKQVSVYSSMVGSDTWTPMTGLQGIGFNGGYVSGKIVLTQGEGYFYAPDGLVYGGPATQGTSWTQLGTTAAPCQPDNGAANGSPTWGQLAAAQPGDLALACPVTGVTGQEVAYTSADNGQSWVKQGTFTVTGSPTSLAAEPNGTLTLATTGGIYTSKDNGLTWSQTLQGPSGGFSYVGLTSPALGVAVPADSAQSNSVWVTKDGGSGWNQSSVKNS